MATVNKNFKVKNGLDVNGPTSVNVNSSSDALRITQVGSGNALVVEDSTNPDSTPLIVTSNGSILSGATNERNVGDGFQTAIVNDIYIEQDNSGLTPFTAVLNRADTNGPRIILGKSRGTSAGSNAIVSDGDNLGSISFSGADGSSLTSVAAQITAQVNGTPGINDMPGRLMFSTTSPGASSPTERMRITSFGNVGIGTSSIGARLHVSADNGGGVIVSTPSTADWAFAALTGQVAGVSRGLITFQREGSSSNGSIAFSTTTGGTANERMRINSAGSVGIGTNNPLANLHIENSNSFLPQIILRNTNTDNSAPYLIISKAPSDNAISDNDAIGNILWSSSDTSGTARNTGMISVQAEGSNAATTPAPSRMAFAVSNSGGVLTERMRIDSAGNIGIGRNTASHRIHIQSTTNQLAITSGETNSTYGFDAGSGYFDIKDMSDSSESIRLTNNSDIRFNVASSERMRISSNGNVGIGTPAPNHPLQVKTTTDLQGIFQEHVGDSGVARFTAFRSRANGAAVQDGDIISRFQSTTSVGGGVFPTLAFIEMAMNGTVSSTSAPSRVSIFTTPSGSVSPTERLRITSAGNIGIGTTSPTTKLHINAEVSDDNNYSYDSNSLMVVHQTPTSTTTLNDAQTVLMLARQGTGGQAYGAAATFNLSRFESVGANSRTRLDIGLSNASFDAKNIVMSLYSNGNVNFTGGLTATTKSFDIEHPTKENMRLRYGSLEGPENGVYIRGKSNSSIITLPDYWTGLVHEDTITVQLTPIGKHKNIYVKDIFNNTVTIGGARGDLEFFYFIQAERKDVDKLVVEYGS